jgi:hypothetical protein
MKNVIGGLIAIILGIFSLTLLFPAFINVIVGIVPLLLIIGGGLTIFLNHEERQEEKQRDMEDEEIFSPTPPIKIEPVETEPVETEPVETEPAGIEPEKPIDNMPQLVGNTASLVFHTPDCKFSKSKKCTAVFNTREEAQGQGYKPCGVCKP